MKKIFIIQVILSVLLTAILAFGIDRGEFKNVAMFLQKDNTFEEIKDTFVNAVKKVGEKE